MLYDNKFCFDAKELGNAYYKHNLGCIQQDLSVLSRKNFPIWYHCKYFVMEESEGIIVKTGILRSVHNFLEQPD
jgi:hypothetical protein